MFEDVIRIRRDLSTLMFLSDIMMYIQLTLFAVGTFRMIVLMSFCTFSPPHLCLWTTADE